MRTHVTSIGYARNERNTKQIKDGGHRQQIIIGQRSTSGIQSKITCAWIVLIFFFLANSFNYSQEKKCI